jgi:pimeloyl-ACP methyl ester carboxylesterase
MKKEPFDHTEPVSRFYTSQGIRLHCVDWGNHGKPILILIHGGMDHARSWDPVARVLKHDFHVVVPDLRGHGDSSWAPGSMYSLLDSVLDTVCLIEELHSDSVSIIGHSYGAAVSFLYTGFYPEKVKKLVLIEGGGITSSRMSLKREDPIWERIPKWIESVQTTEKRPRSRFKSISDAEARIRKRLPFLPDEQIQHLAYHGVTRNDDGTYSWKYDEFSKILSPIRFNEQDLDGLYKRICCPVLFLYGSKGWSGDMLDKKENSHAHHMISVEIPGAGHWPHHERFDDFIEKVTSFLNEE